MHNLYGQIPNQLWWIEDASKYTLFTNSFHNRTISSPTNRTFSLMEESLIVEYIMILQCMCWENCHSIEQLNICLNSDYIPDYYDLLS